MQIATAPLLAAQTVTLSKPTVDFGQDFDVMFRSLDAAGDLGAADVKSLAQGEDPAMPVAESVPDLAEIHPSGTELAPVQLVASSPVLTSPSKLGDEITAKPIASQSLPPTHAPFSVTELPVTATPDQSHTSAAIVAETNPGSALPSTATQALNAATALPLFTANRALQTSHPVDQSPVPQELAESGAPTAGTLAKAIDVVTESANTATPPADKIDPRPLSDKGRERVALPAHNPTPDGVRPFAPHSPELPPPITQIVPETDTILGSEVPNLFREIAAPQYLATSNGQIVRPDGTFASPAQQISQAIVRMGANGPVELALNPAELGQVRFEMTTTGDKLHITLFVERPDAMDLIRRNGDQLLADLRLSGFSNPSLSFGDWSQRDSHSPQASNPPKGAEPEGQSAQIGASLALAHNVAAFGRLDIRL